MAEENEKPKSAPKTESREEESLKLEEERTPRPRWREIFHQAFEKARREQEPVPSRRELGRDRSRTLFLLVGAAIAVLVLFLVVFSSPNTKKRTMTRPPGTPDLGRRVTPGQQASGQTGSVTPLLNADTRQTGTQDSEGVTAEDVGRTARPEQPGFGTPTPPTSPANKATVKNREQYALGQIDFSGAGSSQQPGSDVPRQQASGVRSAAGSSESKDLRKPSLVFVRSTSGSAPSTAPQVAPARLGESPVMTELPAGTRLVARLQSAVSTAVSTPVVAAIEYNYERDGEIVVPAGAQALGKLEQADPSGNVAIHFDTFQMPDGTREKIDATAMSLSYGPLKGDVSGKGTGKRFLVRSLTGVGTVAAYLVGAGGGSGFNGPLSESALLRDRIASNIGMAGDQELNSLVFNQHIVVTIPGNTRFFVVLEKGAVGTGAEIRPRSRVSEARSATALPSIEELRQLMQLKQELSEMVQQGGAQNPAAPGPQQ
jgi:hypothetical protein